MAKIHKHAYAERDLDSSRYDQIGALWLLRVVLRHGATRFRLQKMLNDEDWTTFLGMGCSPDDYLSDRPAPERLDSLFDLDESERRLTEAEMRSALKRRLRALEAARPSLEGTTLWTNISWLGDKLRLDEVERQIVALAVLLKGHPNLINLAQEIGARADRFNAVHLIANMIESEAALVTKAVSKTGALAVSGLIYVKQYSHGLTELLECRDHFAETMLTLQTTQSDLLSCFFREAEPAGLHESDFA